MTGSSPERRFIPPDRSIGAPSPTSSQEAEQDAAPPLQEQTAAPSASTPPPTPGPLWTQTGSRARRVTNHPQAAVPPSPHSLRASAPAGGGETSIHSETTRHAALTSASEPFGHEADAYPSGSKKPWASEYVGSNREARHTQGRHQRELSLRPAESLNCRLA